MNRQNIDKLISEALAIEEEAAKEAGSLGYMARALVRTTMPHSKPKADVFQRQNGRFHMAMMANPLVGLPYGTIPRLLMAWLTTEAVRIKDPVITLGTTLSEFMEVLELVPTGGRWGTITRLRDQMTRLFSCAVSCTYIDENNIAGLNMTVAEDYHLWWSPKHPQQAALWASTVTLGRRFFDEVTTHPVPVDLRALKALRRSPLALDIYGWLTYRVSYLAKPTTIPWEVLRLQFGADYADTPSGRQGFRRSFMAHIRKVHVVYPQARIEANEHGMTIKPSAPHILKLPRG